MSFGLWFRGLETQAAAAFKKLETEAVDEAEKVAKAIGPVIVADLEDFLSAIGTIAIGAVLKQAPLVLSGAEKFGAAVTHVVQQVEEQGKTIAIQDAQMAVQGAYHAVQVAVSSRPAP